MTIARACRPPTQESCRRLGGWWIAQHPRSVPSRKFVTEERATPPPRRTPRTRKPPEGASSLGIPPPPPPPRVTDATFYPLCGPVPDSMNPATVRSTSETNRRCMRLYTIMQRACDRYTRLVTVVGPGSASSPERKRHRDTGHQRPGEPQPVRLLDVGSRSTHRAVYPEGLDQSGIQDSVSMPRPSATRFAYA